MVRFCSTLVLAVCVAQVSYGLTWDTEVASDSSNRVYFQTGLAIDGGGVPYMGGEGSQTGARINYRDPANPDLWTPVTFWGVGNVRQGDMDFTPNGNVHFVFDDQGRTEVGPPNTHLTTYDYAGGTGWSELSGFGFGLNLPKVDVKGNALTDLGCFGTYNARSSTQEAEFGADPYPSFDNQPVYASYDGSQWTAERILDSTTWLKPTGDGNAMRFDNAGNPSVLMFDRGENKLGVFTRDTGGAWQANYVPNTTSAYSITHHIAASFAYHGDDLYVTYMEMRQQDPDSGRYGKLYFAEYSDGAWQEEVLLDEDLFEGASVSPYVTTDMDINSEGKVAIAYCYLETGGRFLDTTTGETRFIYTDDSGSFTTPEVIPEPDTVTKDATYGYNVVFDPQDDSTVHVLYRTPFNGSGGSMFHDTYFATASFPSAVLLGDFDGNGAFNGLDIPDFKAALADPEGWATDNPDMPHPNEIGDFDGNGAFNGLDIPGFKTALAGTAIPEPATLALLAAGAVMAIRRRR